MRTSKPKMRIYLNNQWQEVYAYLTEEQLISFIKKMFDAFFIDCCPGCQLPLDWRNHISEDDIKRKIEELNP